MLSTVEKVENALPHPATLFALFALLVILMSGITSLFHLSVEHPGTGETIEPVNLITIEGLHRIIEEMVTDFTGFAPLGVVLVAMLGIGIAESTGFIGTALRLMVLKSPKKILTFVIVFAGILSNTASEVEYVLLCPHSGIYSKIRLKSRDRNSYCHHVALYHRFPHNLGNSTYCLDAVRDTRWA